MPPRTDLVRDLGLADFLAGKLSGTALVNRDRIAILTLLLTYRCPAACDHCVFSSNPQHTATTLDSDVAKKLIAAAARQQPPPVVGFSGGEPFVRFGLMRDLVAYAAEHGLASEVVSSSTWVRSFDHARHVLDDLAARGLATYATSVDRFHTPFVAPEKMRWAVLAAQAAGLHVIINYQTDPVRHGEGLAYVEDYLAGTLELPLATIRSFQLNPLITTPVGRARTNVDVFLYPDKDFREGCPMVTEVVTLSPAGLLYPCCGMVVGEPPEAASLFIQAQLAEQSVDEIAALLDALKRDLFFKILQYLGPYRLLKALQQRDPTLVVRERYTGACDVCLEFTTNPRVAAVARDLLAECDARLAALTTTAASAASATEPAAATAEIRA